MKSKIINALALFFSLCCGATAQQQNEYALIPLPQKLQKNDGVFCIQADTRIVLNGDAAQLKSQVEDLKSYFLKSEPIVEECRFEHDPNVFVLSLDETLNDLGAEGYRLIVQPDQVQVSSATPAGIFYGVQTLKQLASDNRQTIPACVIEDYPRMQWRGFMLDCSRHFWTIDELKAVIDQLALIKMNRLHLHLTDNQGWRLEIKKYPELTAKGTYYKDFPELSGQYYTQAQMRELITYAEERQVMIVPEIDLPGHSRAVLAAYPELSCRGGDFEVYPMEQPSDQVKRWYEVMLCAGNPKTYEFVKDVVAEVAALFPSSYIHLGGDEVGKDIWKGCPHCQKMISDHGLKDEEELQDYFTRTASQAIMAHHKRMIGWGEINDRGAAQNQDVVMVWRDHGTPQAVKALKAGLNVVMCPQHGCYFDWGYSGNSTKKVYSWDPVPEEVTDQEAQLVLGAQACLWTERVATTRTIEERIFPRILALSETVWLQPEQKQWDDFLKRLDRFYPLMDQWGIHYFNEGEIDAEEFKPGKEKPALVRHAFIETNMGIFVPYHPEYVFDGRRNSYFWTNRTPQKGEWLLLRLGEKVNVKEIEVITGDAKDYLEFGDLEISTDGKRFKKVADFKDGLAKVKLSGAPIQAIRINITEDHKGWVIIKEIVLK